MIGHYAFIFFIVFVIGLILFTTIDDIRTKAYWRYRCDHCKAKYRNWVGFIEITHGIDSESDSWDEHICPECQKMDKFKNRKFGFVTEHGRKM